MTDPGESSPSPTVPSPNPSVPSPNPSVPSTTDQLEPLQDGTFWFMCVLPCNKPPIKYLGCLDGCSRGLHLTTQELEYFQVALYGKMAAAIMASDDPPQEGATSTTTTSEQCGVCKARLVPKPNAPIYYLENCDHQFHHGCLDGWRRGRFFASETCHQCLTKSSRALLWPHLLPSATAKSQLFQAQKHAFRMNVAPESRIQVDKCYDEQEDQVFEFKIEFKTVTMRKGPPTKVQVPEKPSQVVSGPIKSKMKVCTEEERRASLLSQIRCPPGRKGCPTLAGSKDEKCEFWHNWPKKAPSKTQRLTAVNELPKFYCVVSALNHPYGPGCNVRIRVHSDEMVRCTAGFHPTLNDLSWVNGFGDKMARQILTPPVVPNPDQDSLVCALCHKVSSDPPNELRMHLQQCRHWLHPNCLATIANSTNPNRVLYLKCPVCNKLSMRALAWPGLFRSDLMKGTIFGLQLANFKLNVQPDTKLAIGEVANRVNVFTFDYGGPNMIDIDFGTVVDTLTIYYD